MWGVKFLRQSTTKTMSVFEGGAALLTSRDGALASVVNGCLSTISLIFVIAHSFG